MDWREMFHKSRVYPVVLLALCYVLYLYRTSDANQNGDALTEGESLVSITGTTMGSIPYVVLYIDSVKSTTKAEIDSKLQDFNQIFSTYIPDSEISRFNQSESGILVSEEMKKVYLESKQIAEMTNGSFDPTVMPLVNAWGFGYEERKNIPNQIQVDSIMEFVGHEKVTLVGDSLTKTDPRIELDFSAIAKGYACDYLITYLQTKGVKNAFVEIGGEIMAIGRKFESRPWYAGVREPNKGSQEVNRRIKLENRSIATSGNYENFYEDDDTGELYAHTINPTNGKQVRTTVLSASVIADNCMKADALATAVMVMGKEEAIQFFQSHQDLSYYIIYSEEGMRKGLASEGFDKITIK